MERQQAGLGANARVLQQARPVGLTVTANARRRSGRSSPLRADRLRQRQ